MYKKILLSLFLFTVLMIPLTTKASTFTSLKAQLEYISNKIANFGTENNSGDSGEVLGITSNPTITFTSNPSKVPYNGSSTLSWTSTNTTRCNASGYSSNPNFTEGSAWMTPYEKSLNGSQTISNLKTNTHFYIICWGYDGTYAVEEAVVEVETRIPKVDLKADPVYINFGGSTKLTWTTSNVQNPCVASGGWSGNKSLGINVSEVISNIQKDTIFNLTCPGYLQGMSSTGTVKVFIKPNDPKKDEDGSGLGGAGLVVTSSPEVSKTTSNSNNICSFTFTKNLGYGNVDTRTNKEVSYLQSILVDEKLLPSASVTGKFYSQTLIALRNFQKKHKLTINGKVDANTRVKLNELFQNYCNN